MERKWRFCLVCAILLCVAASAHAMVTTIDFSATLPGAPTGRSVVLAEQLAGYGIHFSTTDPEGVYWWGPEYSWSSARYSISAGDLGTIQQIDPIRVDFDNNVTDASIRGFDGGGDVDTLTLKAFNGAGIMVDSDVIKSVFSTPGSVASVSASEIAHITFEVSVPGDHGLFFDDLTFTTSDVIPAPGAVLLGGIGVSVVGWLRSKRVL